MTSLLRHRSHRRFAGLSAALVVVANWHFAAAQEAAKHFVMHDGPKAVAAISFRDEGGQVRTLADFKGKIVLLNLWATWCVPCREEMPALDRVAASRPALVFLEIDLQENPEAVTAFFVRYGLTHLQPVLDPQGKTTTRYGVLSLPTTFFVDRDGVIQHIKIGGPMSDEEIQRGIAKAGGGS